MDSVHFCSLAEPPFDRASIFGLLENCEQALVRGPSLLYLSLSLSRWPFRTSAVQYSRMNSDAKSDSAARIRDARTRLNASQMACTCPTKSPCQIAAENFCAPTTPVALMALSQSAIVLAQKRNRSVKIVASNLISSKTGTPDYSHFV